LPEFKGASFRLARPLGLTEITEQTAGTAEPLVVYDELGANHASRIALSEGAEAAQPFRPELKPVDAYNAAIIDEIRI
jgi:ethanolamine utilization protein EutN